MTLLSHHDFRPSADAPHRCAYCSRVAQVHPEPVLVVKR